MTVRRPEPPTEPWWCPHCRIVYRHLVGAKYPPRHWCTKKRDQDLLMRPMNQEQLLDA